MDAWRQHFSREAGDLLQIIRWAEQLTPEEFRALLLCCFRRSRASRINERTVLRVLALRRQL